LNRFGHFFSVSTFGESHGPGIGCVIDQCPPGIALSATDFSADLERRATGRTRHTSQRKESDVVEILSGVFDGKTTGTALALWVRNTDQRSDDYSEIAKQFRPGHADLSYQHKYGLRDYRGGGRSSARETTARVMAGVIAKKYLDQKFGTRVQAYLSRCGDFVARSDRAIDFAFVESTPLFWPDSESIDSLETYLDGLRKSGDSVGGRVSVIASNVPGGLGAPIYAKLDSDLASALMGINAVKAVEIGDGVEVAAQRGSEHRDEIRSGGFQSNHSGGILGGISTGQSILAHVSIKPTSSILVPGQSIDIHGNEIDLVTKGRHDPCVAIRAPAIVEAMVALVLIDHVMMDRAQCADVERGLSR
jgi:chorismate synthase